MNDSSPTFLSVYNKCSAVKKWPLPGQALIFKPLQASITLALSIHYSATWTQRQAGVSHPAIGIKNRPKWSVFFPLWPCEDIQILQIYPFHFYFFDFQNFPISNVLFIVGCRGKRTVCILIGAHHDIKHSNQQKGTPIQSSFSVGSKQLWIGWY